MSISSGVRWSSAQIEKSSPRWRIIGRDKIKEIEEIVQRSEVKRSENGIEAGLNRARSTDVHRYGPVDCPVDRGKGTVDRAVDRLT